MKKTSPQAEALKDKGNELMQKGKSKEAIAAYREAIACDPTYIPAYANLGMVLSMTGSIDEAEKVYLQGMKANPGDYRLLFNAGIFYVRTEQYERSVELFSEMFTNIPDDAKAGEGAMGNLYLSVAYLQQQEFEQALEALKTALDLNPEAEPNVLALLEETIDEHLESYDDEPALLCIAGYVEMISVATTDAVKIFRKAIKADNNAADAYFGLGLALGGPRSGDSPFDNKTSSRIHEAVKAFELAAQLKPKWIEAHYQIGILSLQLVDLESPFRAQAALQRVIELAAGQTPENKFALQAKKLLQTHAVLKSIADL